MNKKVQLRKIGHLTGHKASVFAIAEGFGPHTVLTGSGDGWIVQWDLRQPGEGKLLAKVEGQIFAITVLREQRVIVAGSYAGRIHFIDLKNRDNLKIVDHHPKGVFAILEVGNHIFSAGGDGVLTKWSDDFQPVESILLAKNSLRSIDYSKERNELVIGSSDGNIYFVNPDTLKMVGRILEAHDNSVFTARYLANNIILSGGRDAQMKVWQLGEKVNCLSSQSAHWFTVNDIAIHQQKRIFVTASRDKTMRIWDADDYTLLKVINKEKNEGHVNSVNKLFWSTYKDYLISVSDDRSVAIWDID